MERSVRKQGVVKRKKDDSGAVSVRNDLAVLLKFLYASDSEIDSELIQRADLTWSLNAYHSPNRIGGNVLMPFSLSKLKSQELHSLRHDLARRLDVFMDQEVWFSPSGLELGGISVWRDNQGQLRLDVYGPQQTEFWAGIAALLVRGGDLLRRCQWQKCRRIFVRSGNSKHCSSACGGRERSSRHYAENKVEILERRHADYARKRRRIQPRAKVARRSRLQPIATAVKTGRKRTPQLTLRGNKNARHSTRRNSGR
jgi:hypothetical protein